jgi:hypothetical protein
MSGLAPIDKNFVPYTKRPRNIYNSSLFVDGGRGKGRSSARIALQGSPFVGSECDSGWPCSPCGGPGANMVCTRRGGACLSREQVPWCNN